MNGSLPFSSVNHPSLDHNHIALLLDYINDAVFLFYADISNNRKSNNNFAQIIEEPTSNYDFHSDLDEQFSNLKLTRFNISSVPNHFDTFKFSF